MILSNKARKINYIYLGVFLSLLLGLMARLIYLGRVSLDFDEAYTIVVAMRPFKQIILGTAEDGYPPLYYLLMHLWIKLGIKDYLVRSSSLLFGLGTIALVYIVGKNIFEERTAILAALFTALANCQVEYSQKARMYTMVSFFACLTAYLVLRAYQSGNWHFWLGYSISAIAGLYVHNYFLFLPIAFGLYGLLQFKRYRFSPARWLIAQLVIIILYLPWLKVLLGQFSRVREGFWIPEVGLFSPIYILEWFAVGEFIRNLTLRIVSNWFFGIPLVISLGVMIVLLLGRWRGEEIIRSAEKILPSLTFTRDNGDGILLLFFWLVIPIVLAYILSLKQSIFYNRYFLLISPAYYLLVAKGIFNIKIRKVPLFFVAGIIIIQLISLGKYYATEEEVRIKPAAIQIQNNFREGDVIVHAGDDGWGNEYAAFTFFPSLVYHQGELEEYLLTKHKIPYFLGGNVLKPEQAISDMKRVLADHSRLWLIMRADNPDRSADKLVGDNSRRASHRSFGQVNLYLYEKKVEKDSQ